MQVGTVDRPPDGVAGAPPACARPLGALAQPYGHCHSFDTYNLLPVGNPYAANDHALFRTVTA